MHMFRGHLEVTMGLSMTSKLVSASTLTKPQNGLGVKGP